MSIVVDQNASETKSKTRHKLIKPTPKIVNIGDTYFGPAHKEFKPFKLASTFIEPYIGKKPNFGFNGLGEFVFYRTYSRDKAEGGKESFLDVAKRVVEGCYEIQRRHCMSIHIPWDYERAQDSAQEMFERIWSFKFLPPGRGLWMMGTDFMYARGSAALNNCFSGDTEYITRDGIKTLKETVGTTQRVLAAGGKWVDAKIKAFGEQELYRLVVKRGVRYKTIMTTADHRWFVKSKQKNLVAANGVEGEKPVYKTRECHTTDLKNGMRLLSCYGSGIKNNYLRPSIVGIQHGICYGDGTTGSSDSNHGTYLYLCGPKNLGLLKYFQGFHVTPAPERGSEGAMRVADLPRFYRNAPVMNEASTYLYGWLAGYFAADGRITKLGTPQISSKHKENLEVVRSVCAILGIGTHDITSGYQTVRYEDGRVKKFLQYRITLYSDHLTDEFFLMEHHLERFKQRTARECSHYENWNVVSVEETGLKEETYCAQVPDYNSFALAGNILTGNCGMTSTDMKRHTDPAEPYCFMMDMSMLGVGIGFDTKGAGQVEIQRPNPAKYVEYEVHDSREGWVDSLRTLIHSYTKKSSNGEVVFNYEKIRPAGSTITGFGGTAAGANILSDMHEMFRKHLDRKIGKTLSSGDIVDLMNYIGKCVVAGNVRRCLPKGTLVHMKNGLTPIEDVKVGDLVLTSHGYHEVVENVHQGKQEVVTIITQTGEFKCTDKHRIAVFETPTSYVWKKANQLRPGDRMVFVDSVIDGQDTSMPFSEDLNTELTTEKAWLIGAIHGDGYVYINKRREECKRGGSNSIMIAINQDEYHDDILHRFRTGVSQLGEFNVRPQPSADNCMKYRVTSSSLARYFHNHIKKPRVSLVVPDFILKGRPEIRAAYLAGLLDTDGSVKNRPTTLVSSVYPKFIKDVQTIYSSLGIPTKLKLRREATETTQAIYCLALVGDHSINKFKMLVEPHSAKKVKIFKNASSHSYGFPADMIRESGVKWKRAWDSSSKQMTIKTAKKVGFNVGNLIPIEVLEIVKTGTIVETYDLSVPAVNEFVAEGMLVHNTAQIAFGEAGDEEYSSLKNPYAFMPDNIKSMIQEKEGMAWGRATNSVAYLHVSDFDTSSLTTEEIELLTQGTIQWSALNNHRWASNNSVFAKVGMPYKQYEKDIATNGEPGFLWLDNCRNFGRMIDGYKEGIDGEVVGSNPCFSGDMRLLTEDGYVSIYDLWVAGGMQEYIGIGGEDPISRYGSINVINHRGSVKATNVYRTGECQDVFAVTLSSGDVIKATANHQFIVVTDTSCERVRLSDLAVGDKIPLAFGEKVQAHFEESSWRSTDLTCSSVVSVKKMSKADTYCLTEPGTNTVIIEGHFIGQCAEQSLEDSELCCLVESFPNLHQDDEDYKRTLKFAFLYAKTVTLLPTHSARTNAVMLRNRRIGLSQSGIVQAFAQFGRREVLNKFCDEGYNVIKQWDKVYSKWLCIPQSIKITSVKPSGTVSLLTGCTPGIHYPEAQHYWRRVRVKSDSPLVQILKDAGYHVEPSVTDPVNTVVIKFAVSDPRVKPTNEVSIFEQVANTVDYQRYWADNQVSVTIKFKAEEAKDIASVLEIYEDQLKSISFLPHSNHGYAQAPYEPCTEQEVLDYNAQLKDLDFSAYYGKEEGSNFCDSDSCAV